ncbi:MAG TPA: hypothetical protein VLI07_11635 [Candidatus Binatus sp.]|nr:hypothetical protein [Candidatus Binatus sp.]
MPRAVSTSALVLLAIALWLPRLRGPLDLRYDAGVYYVLGTSLAEGKGYRLLNEPGAIQAIQYPPLLPLFAAAHQWIAGGSNPAVAGHWLRLSFALLFLGYIVGIHQLARKHLSPRLAFLAALLTLLQLGATWLSDLFFAEIPFAFVTVLFLLSAGRKRRRFPGWPAGALGAIAFLLRTMGLALLGAWVGESLLRQRFREAAGRAALALVPVLAWQAYVAHVKGSPEYATPAYAYQRAGYQYYNVGYVENLAYVDPFVPELGNVSPGLLMRRMGRNLLDMPLRWGEAVSARAAWAEGPVAGINRRVAPLCVPFWTVNAALGVLGSGALLGLVLLAFRGEWLIPLYVASSVMLMSLTPWPAQFDRYLVPLTPLLAVALLVALGETRRHLFRLHRATRGSIGALLVVVVLGILSTQAAVLLRVYTTEHQPATSEDASGQRREYRLFFYPRAWQEYDAALEWLKRQARPEEIVATSTPHWVYLQTGLRAVMPPFEPDVQEAERLVDSVPVDYLIVDDLGFVDVTRRYAAPLVKAFPEHWALIHSTPDGGTHIYRRMTR